MIEIWVKMPSGWKRAETMPGKFYGNSLERARDTLQVCYPCPITARWAA